ncbi:hypothetical protein B9J09_10950 [Xylella fastidiosa subsp. pauca]|nr:hypothetical protein B9J09_10950 [Xylella fastidiosa subsp. pauca]TNW22359.1 hypothetical protein EIP73_04920 [Xylella fastidiosa subsp. pauca]TNW26345.1 hypothetical protein EIP74_08510 [Xylella fastidiosa subsp. pauca]
MIKQQIGASDVPNERLRLGDLTERMCICAISLLQRKPTLCILHDEGLLLEYCETCINVFDSAATSTFLYADSSAEHSTAVVC